MERPGICFVKVTRRLGAGGGVCLPGRHMVPGDTAVRGAGLQGGSVYVGVQGSVQFFRGSGRGGGFRAAEVYYTYCVLYFGYYRIVIAAGEAHSSLAPATGGRGSDQPSPQADDR